MINLSSLFAQKIDKKSDISGLLCRYFEIKTILIVKIKLSVKYGCVGILVSLNISHGRQRWVF